MSLSEFLDARISEDENLARAASWEPDEFDDECDNPWSATQSEFAGRGGDLFRHVLHNNPTRVLAECAAKRAMLESLSALMGVTLKGDPVRCGMYAALSDVAMDLAAVYADHPDYLKEWSV